MLLLCPTRHLENKFRHPDPEFVSIAIQLADFREEEGRWCYSIPRAVQPHIMAIRHANISL